MIEISKEAIAENFKKLQKNICTALEIADGKSSFEIEPWQHVHGGGGITTIIQNGNIIEKGGVNFSAVSGDIPSFLITEKQHSLSNNLQNAKTFFATGVSIVIHPNSPLAPIIHMNVRYFETDNGNWWFGGGIDLTPHYVHPTDAIYFHQQLKQLCDHFNPSYYQKFKLWADEYFFIPHRNETRGIGGIFFDRLSADSPSDKQELFDFVMDLGNLFAPLYVELLKRNRDKAYNNQQKNWQLLRRGRYVEFNLIYDKGTQFGLQTNGRAESILMSLPPQVNWQYNYKPTIGSAEQQTLDFLKKEIDWVNFKL